jgi:heme-degrading monooxygenase HmoA
MAFCLVQDFVEPETDRSTTNYDAMHARLAPHAGEAKGFIAHSAGWTDDGGFRIVEFWESREDCEAFMRDHVMPAVQEVIGEGAAMPTTTAYDLHSLVLAPR